MAAGVDINYTEAMSVRFSTPVVFLCAVLVWMGFGLARPAAALEVAQVFDGGDVVLYEGSKAGLKEGQVLTILRGETATGQVQIDEVSDFTARGRTIKGDVQQGDRVAGEGASLKETPVPFQSAGDTPRTAPGESSVSVGRMKRMDDAPPENSRTPVYSIDDLPPSGSGDVIAAKPVDDDAPVGGPKFDSPPLSQPSVVAVLDGGKGRLPPLSSRPEKPAAQTGSLGLVTRPTAVVYKPKGGTVGYKYGYNQENQHTRTIYTGRFAPSEKMELYLESTDNSVSRENIASYGGKYVLSTLKKGAQAALYLQMNNADEGASEYGAVATFPNPAGNFSVGAYLSDGGLTGLKNGRKVQLGEDYGLFIGLERELILGLSLALEYDTLAMQEGNTYGAELRWKRGSNYSLTAAVQDVDSFRDATLGAFFSF